ncbi:hypothetical protein [Fuscibacter oryzae]|uniref:Uncharacterized protein n=1 Tax=Fuscibacter oryzae TaxID=2803939 RepID=A0A8J7SUE8_9RHOB|nr:hypothetical protein [Fuscibacter oryzae]MBL4926664.1 hypothetical protein [Fuscibacter oryzae]
MRYLLISPRRLAPEARKRCGMPNGQLIQHTPDSSRGLRHAEEDLERAISSCGPLPWLVAAGPAVALLQHVVTRTLSARIMGAILLHPADWAEDRIALPLTDTPFAFPVLTLGASAFRVAAWQAVELPANSQDQILLTPAFTSLLAARRAALQRAGALVS